MSWTQAATNVDWLDIQTAAIPIVSHDGKMWVIGGGEANAATNDVHYSLDGETWTEAGAKWSERPEHQSVTYDGKMWVMGGRRDGEDLNDVWYSEDGVSWTQATGSAGWE